MRMNQNRLFTNIVIILENISTGQKLVCGKELIFTLQKNTQKLDQRVNSKRKKNIEVTKRNI